MAHAQTLKSGWYAIGFKNLDDVVEWGPIYHHEDGYWTDEAGEEVERLWDPVLQGWVAVDAADDYAFQG